MVTHTLCVLFWTLDSSPKSLGYLQGGVTEREREMSGGGEWEWDMREGGYKKSKNKGEMGKRKNRKRTKRLGQSVWVDPTSWAPHFQKWPRPHAPNSNPIQPLFLLLILIANKLSFWHWNFEYNVIWFLYVF